MKFTLDWLKTHLDTEASLAEIEVGLTAIGLEVEGIDDPAAGGFVVGHILEPKHPDADKLKLCRSFGGGFPGGVRRPNARRPQGHPGPAGLYPHPVSAEEGQGRGVEARA
jgi:hypothetical protein